MANLLTLVSDDICASEEFRADFEQLTINELYPLQKNPHKSEQIARLLEASTVLSLSKTDNHKRLAYKIVIYLLNQYKFEFDSIPFVTELVLTRLGDLPVVGRMISIGDGSDYFSYFDGEKVSDTFYNPNGATAISTLRFPEVLEKKSFSQVRMANKRVVSLTDFQADILKLLKTNLDIAFSAPTSAGKSYVLANYLGDRFAERKPLSVVYIAPTKALVAEVQGRIIETLTKMEIPRDYLIFTGASVLSGSEIRDTARKVFVLTQERLQELIANRGVSFGIDILIIDEAQQLANEARGIVFEDAVRELIQRNASCQKIFISPYVSNLDRFAKIFAIDSSRFRSKYTNLSPVAQNVFFLNFPRRKVEGKYLVNLSALSRELLGYSGRNRIELARIETDRPLSANWEKKLWVTRKLVGGQDSTLVYCNTRSECRRMCEEIVKGAEEKLSDFEIVSAITFLQEHVHPDFYLADYLRFGVGYHYGTMPQFVKTYIRKLFDSKSISYLACTSTLLEGVNLPAKNLVVYKPRRGQFQKMTNLDVKNLVGRAGRLKWDYYGNIYCIDVDDWDTKDEPFEEKPETIESASITVLSEHMVELLKYLSGTGFETSLKTVASMATSLLMKQLMFPEKDFLSDFKRIHEDLSQENLDELHLSLIRAVDNLAISDRGVYLRNRSIDPRYQDELYQELKKQTTVRILPPYPRDDDFWNRLKSIFFLIARYILRDEHDSYVYYSVIASKWIGEVSYKGILDSQIDYQFGKTGIPIGEKERKSEVNGIIENLNEVLEEKIRFDYTRGLKCYLDMIQLISEEEGASQDYCKDLHLYLEAGASSKPILYLIGAGLSRNTAIEIYERMGGSTLPDWNSVAATLNWLEEKSSLLKQNISSIIYDDIERLLGTKRTEGDSS